jgi:hypothetical protein
MMLYLLFRAAVARHYAMWLCGGKSAATAAMHEAMIRSVYGRPSGVPEWERAFAKHQ